MWSPQTQFAKINATCGTRKYWWRGVKNGWPHRPCGRFAEWRMPPCKLKAQRTNTRAGHELQSPYSKQEDIFKDYWSGTVSNRNVLHSSLRDSQNLPFSFLLHTWSTGEPGRPPSCLRRRGWSHGESAKGSLRRPKWSTTRAERRSAFHLRPPSGFGKNDCAWLGRAEFDRLRDRNGTD